MQRGSVYETWLQRDLVDTGLTQASNIFVYETVDAAVRDLREQRLDLVILDKRVAETSVAQGGLKLVGSGLNPQRYAIAMRNGAEALRVQINSALTQLQNEGRIAALAQQYLNAGPGTIITPPVPTATTPAQPTTPPTQPTTAPCVNGMRFVADLNLSDNNMQSPPPISPGQPFSKGWRIQNSGTCAWTTSFRLVYVSGNVPGASMGGQPTPVQGFVPPGQQYDMFVNLVAPLTPGVYQGLWQMIDDQSRPFGDRIWVGITVPASPTATPPATQTPSPSIQFTVDRDNILQGECSTFTWNVQNATAVYFYAQGEPWQNNQVPPQSTRVACPAATTVYFLRVLNPNGTVEERQITITVRPNVNAPTIAQFVAAPSQVTAGQCVTLQWDVQGSVSRVTISNQFRVVWDNAPSRGNTQDCTGGQPTTIEYRIQATRPRPPPYPPRRRPIRSSTPSTSRRPNSRQDNACKSLGAPAGPHGWSACCATTFWCWTTRLKADRRRTACHLRGSTPINWSPAPPAVNRPRATSRCSSPQRRRPTRWRARRMD